MSACPFPVQPEITRHPCLLIQGHIVGPRGCILVQSQRTLTKGRVLTPKQSTGCKNTLALTQTPASEVFFFGGGDHVVSPRSVPATYINCSIARAVCDKRSATQLTTPVHVQMRRRHSSSPPPSSEDPQGGFHAGAVSVKKVDVDVNIKFNLTPNW